MVAIRYTEEKKVSNIQQRCITILSLTFQSKLGNTASIYITLQITVQL